MPKAPLVGATWIRPPQTLSATCSARSEWVLFGLTQNGEWFIYDPLSSMCEVAQVNVHPRGLVIQALESGANGYLYLGGYHGGLSIYAPSAEKVVGSAPTFPQTEGIGRLDEHMYMGTYRNANIYRLDPSKGLGKDNPAWLFAVGARQDRPFAFASGDGKVFIGTVPEYGLLGGALTVYDPDADRRKTYPDIIKDQSIISLVYRQGKVYGATSIYGGLGSLPRADAAKVFIWDASTETLLAETVPDLPDIDMPPKAIGELRFGPDGKLWGATYRTIFVMDPKTLQVERAKTIYPDRKEPSHQWRPICLRWGPDGLLYTTLGHRLTVIDPKTLNSQAFDETSLIAIGADGHIYYAKGARLFRMKCKGA
ncbi:MAG: hypothetical protein IMW86_00525 [Hydrogenibacillus sp.]|nr:hypothetical protein [Hydrogenibacillus sp.]